MPDVTGLEDATYERFAWAEDGRARGPMDSLRLPMGTFVSSEQERLIYHILGNWHLRQVASARIRAMPEVIARHPELIEYTEGDAWRTLEDKTRQYLVVSKSLSWLISGNNAFGPGEPDPRGLTPVHHDLQVAARLLADSSPWMSLVAQAQAVVLPALQDASSSVAMDVIDLSDCVSRAAPPTESELARQRALIDSLDAGTINITGYLHDPGHETSVDSCRPDTSQSYPLDDLLDRIDDVTGERG